MDKSYDPCTCLGEIDFDNENELSKILKRDKHTRIEGICTENVFYKELVSKSYKKTTSSIWFNRKNNTYNCIKVVDNIQNITDVDKYILSYFYKKNINTFVVVFNYIEKCFYYVKISQGIINGDFIEYFRVNKKVYPLKLSPPPIPMGKHRNESRLNLSIEYLKSFNMLKQSAIERVFANCYLSTGWYWDIDSFVIEKDKIIGFEVKQKFPTNNGTFGLNLGLSKLFHFLLENGIEIYHIILTKPVWDISYPAIEMYTKENLKENSLWIGSKFSNELLSNNYSSAPSYTSIFTSARLKYFELQPSSFYKLKTFSESREIVLRDLVNNKLNKLKGVEEIPKLDL